MNVDQNYTRKIIAAFDNADIGKGVGQYFSVLRKLNLLNS